MPSGYWVAIPAIIAGIFSLIGIYFTYRLSSKREKFWRKYKDVDVKTISALTGKWDGSLEQEKFPEGFDPIVKLHLKISFEKSVASVDITSTAKNNNEISIVKYKGQGGFIKDEIFLLDYTIDDTGPTGFGHAILNFHRNGRQLSGKILGIGHLTGSIIYGNINLVKIT